MKIETAADKIITPSDQTLSTPPHRPPPTGVEFLKEESLPLNPSSVCQYKGYAYVGMEDGSMERINPDGSVTSPFFSSFLVTLLVSLFIERDFFV